MHCVPLHSVRAPPSSNWACAGAISCGTMRNPRAKRQVETRIAGSVDPVAPEYRNLGVLLQSSRARPLLQHELHDANGVEFDRLAVQRCRREVRAEDLGYGFVIEFRRAAEIEDV